MPQSVLGLCFLIYPDKMWQSYEKKNERTSFWKRYFSFSAQEPYTRAMPRRDWLSAEVPHRDGKHPTYTHAAKHMRCKTTERSAQGGAACCAAPCNTPHGTVLCALWHRQMRKITPAATVVWLATCASRIYERNSFPVRRATAWELWRKQNMLRQREVRPAAPPAR